MCMAAIDPERTAALCICSDQMKPCRTSLFVCVHSLVRQIDQGLRTVTVLGEDGYAGAGPNVDQLAVEHESIAQLLLNFLLHGVQRFPVLHAFKQHDEFVAAHPGYRIVRADRCAEAFSDKLEQLVTDFMPIGVIDLL